MNQLSFDAYELWVAGYVESCIVQPKIKCRFMPCTVIQKVRCCRDCMMCGKPCPIAKRSEAK